MEKILVKARFISKVEETYGDTPEAIAHAVANQTAKGWVNTGVAYATHGSIDSKTIAVFQKSIPKKEVVALENVDELSNEKLLRLISSEETDFYHEFCSLGAVVNFTSGLSLMVADRYLQFNHISVAVGNRVVAIAEDEKSIDNIVEKQKPYVIWQGIKKSICFAVVNLTVKRRE